VSYILNHILHSKYKMAKRKSIDEIKIYRECDSDKQKKSRSIFVSGSFSQKDELRQKMIDLETAGYVVTSFWPDRSKMLQIPCNYEQIARITFDEINHADTLLIFLTDPDKTYAYRGTFTELGYGLGTNRRVIIICEGTCDEDNDKNIIYSHQYMNNIFFWDFRIEHVSSFDDALKLLNGIEVESPYEKYKQQMIDYFGNLTNGIYDHSGNLRSCPPLVTITRY
jgi:nucleoside 2-deoxyribosyltransferase